MNKNNLHILSNDINLELKDCTLNDSLSPKNKQILSPSALGSS